MVCGTRSSRVLSYTVCVVYRLFRSLLHSNAGESEALDVAFSMDPVWSSAAWLSRSTMRTGSVCVPWSQRPCVVLCCSQFSEGCQLPVRLLSVN